MNDAILILAAGQNTRWPTDAPPKELALIAGEPIVARTVRLVDALGYVPTLITQRNVLSLTARNWNPNVSLVTVTNPEPRGSKSECLLTLQDKWWGMERTVVLLGDVVYTERLLRQVLLDHPDGARFYGTDLELYACQWNADVNRGVQRSLQRARAVALRTGQGRLWQFYRAWQSIPVAARRYALVDDSFFYVRDDTRDVDTVTQYTEVRALWEPKAEAVNVTS